MKETTNFGLKKPEENDLYDVNVQNENMDEIDRVLHECKDSIVPITVVDTEPEVGADSPYPEGTITFAKG